MASGAYLMIVRPYDATVASTVPGLPGLFGSVFGGETDFEILGAELPLYLSDRGYVSQAADDPPHQPFRRRLSNPGAFSYTLFDGGDPVSVALPGFATVTLDNGDGALDAYAGLDWYGREALLLRLADRTASLATATVVYRGLVQDVTWDSGEVRLSLTDRWAAFNIPLQTLFYAGTGGLEGGSDLANKAKPLAFGRIAHMGGVLVDVLTNLWQFHVRQVQSFDGFRDRGKPLILGADFPSVAALLAATVGAPGSGADIEEGAVGTCLAAGYARPGGAVTELTAALHGDAAGGYVESTAAIVQRIVTTLAGAANLAPAELVTADFVAVESAQPAPVGYATGTETETIDAVVSSLMAGIGGFPYVTLDGRLGIKILGEAVGPAALSIGQRQVTLGEQPERSAIVPTWKCRVGWAPNFAVLQRSTIADLTPAADVEYLTQARRYALSSDSPTLTRNPKARELTVEAFFALEADAQAEAVRRRVLTGRPRFRHRLPVELDALSIAGLQTVDIGPLGRWSLPSSALGVVVGLEGDLQTGECRVEVLA